MTGVTEACRGLRGQCQLGGLGATQSRRPSGCAAGAGAAHLAPVSAPPPRPRRVSAESHERVSNGNTGDLLGSAGPHPSVPFLTCPLLLVPWRPSGGLLYSRFLACRLRGACFPQLALDSRVWLSVQCNLVLSPPGTREDLAPATLLPYSFGFQVHARCNRGSDTVKSASPYSPSSLPLCAPSSVPPGRSLPPEAPPLVRVSAAARALWGRSASRRLCAFSPVPLAETPERGQRVCSGPGHRWTCLGGGDGARRHRGGVHSRPTGAGSGPQLCVSATGLGPFSPPGREPPGPRDQWPRRHP